MSFLFPRIGRVKQFIKKEPWYVKIQIGCGQWCINVFFFFLYIVDYVTDWAVLYDLYKLDPVDLWNKDDPGEWRQFITIVMIWLMSMTWIHCVQICTWCALCFDLCFETCIMNMKTGKDQTFPDHTLMGVAQGCNPCMKLTCCGCYCAAELDRRHKKQWTSITHLFIPIGRFINAIIEDGSQAFIGLWIVYLSGSPLTSYISVALSLLTLVIYLVWQMWVWATLVIFYGCTKTVFGKTRNTQEVYSEGQRNFSPKDPIGIQHLFILIHGNKGYPEQMYKFKRQLVQNFGYGISIFIPKCNSKDTYHGIDEGGRRISEEFTEFVNEWNHRPSHKIKLTIVAHSLGGLYGRTFLEHIQKDHQDIWDMFVPTSFLTCCSPHLGVKKPDRGLKSYVETAGADVYSELIGETGDDLFLRSEALMKISKPDSLSMKGLAQFKYRTAMGVRSDWVVPLTTATISHTSPFPRISTIMQLLRQTGPIIEVKSYSEFEDKYEDLFKRAEFPCNAGPTPVFQKQGEKKMAVDNHNLVEFNQEMLTNLQTLKWRRLAVSFNIRERRLIMNGTMHGQAFGIDGKASFLPTMDYDDEKGRRFMDFLSKMLYMDHQDAVIPLSPQPSMVLPGKGDHPTPLDGPGTPKTSAGTPQKKRPTSRAKRAETVEMPMLPGLDD